MILILFLESGLFTHLDYLFNSCITIDNLDHFICLSVPLFDICLICCFSREATAVTDTDFGISTSNLN